MNRRRYAESRRNSTAHSKSHDADQIAHVMRELLNLIRNSVQRSLSQVEHGQEVAVT